MTTFGFDRCIDGRVGAEWMRPPRLAETPQQRSIGSLEKGDFGRNRTAHGFKNAGQLLQFGAFAHIDHQRGSMNFSRLHSHLRESGNEFHGQVIHAVVAQILKSLQYGSFTGPAHSRDDDQFWGMWRIMRAGWLCFLSSRRFLALLVSFPR